MTEHYRIQPVEVRGRLSDLAEIAGALSKTYGEGSVPLTWHEKRVLQTLAIGTIQGLMDEAATFALTGNHEDLARCVEHVHEWMTFKEDFHT